MHFSTSTSSRLVSVTDSDGWLGETGPSFADLSNRALRSAPDTRRRLGSPRNAS